jgi:hypothetical protein
MLLESRALGLVKLSLVRWGIENVARHRCGPQFCSMKITQDVREYAAQKEIDEAAALGVGMKEKAEEFVAAGAEVYQKSASQ